MVLTLDGGVMRTVFVEVPARSPRRRVAEVTAVLNERLAGLTLEQIRRSLARAPARRHRPGPDGHELLNIFVQEGEQLFDAALPTEAESVLLGQPSVLAEQPEFSAADRLRRLLALTERPDALGGSDSPAHARPASRSRSAPSTTIRASRISPSSPPSITPAA